MGWLPWQVEERGAPVTGRDWVPRWVAVQGEMPGGEEEQAASDGNGERGGDEECAWQGNEMRGRAVCRAEDER
jgi:hypothetical protein